MTDATKTSTGVQELIARIRDDGMKAGQDEADRLITEARREAADLLSAAKAEAKRIREKADAEIQAEREAGVAALRNAARDGVLELRTVVRDRFQRHVRQLVSESMRDDEFIRSLVLVLAGHAAEQYIKSADARIFVDDVLLAGNAEAMGDQIVDAVQWISSAKLREGIELVPASDVHGGARVQLKGDQLEIDLSEGAISELLLRHLLPRYRSMMQEVE